MNEGTPFATPQAASAAASGTPTAVPTNLPKVWQKRFALIERAGGLKLTKLKDLSFFERTACTFNLLAGLFGPFYYIAKGMWKKGLAYWGLGIAGILVLETLVTVAGFGHLLSRVHYTGAWVALFAMMANRDYYKKVMLGDNGWL